MSGPRPRHERIHELLHDDDHRRLRRVLTRLDEVQIAVQLDNLGPDDQRVIMGLLPVDRRAPVLGNMRYEAAAILVARLAPEDAADLLDDLRPDDAADILGRIDREILAKILARLDEDDAEAIEGLLAYEDDTAGGIMSPRVFTTRADSTVEEAVARLQALELPTHVSYVYVVDKDGRLVGVCSLRQFVQHRPHERVRDFMQAEVVSVRVDADQEDVAELVSRYDLMAVPVVNANDVLIGVVDIDDVVDVIREEATEDILQMAGAGHQLADARSFWPSLRVRWRWLGAAAAGGTVAAFSLASFDASLSEVPALAFFMPVVAGMGGNVGMQSSTIVVRGLAVGFIEADRARRLVLREVALGASLGLLYGVLIGLFAVGLGAEGADPWRLGVVVACGCAGSMVLAALVGTCTPLALDRLGVDPAIATGPFVTTSVDVMGLLFYFWLANVLLGTGGP